VKTERRPEFRCKSSDVETKGRTHHCRLTTHRPGTEHRCICSRSWGDKKATR
jgi:hypothetical protein